MVWVLGVGALGVGNLGSEFGFLVLFFLFCFWPWSVGGGVSGVGLGRGVESAVRCSRFENFWVRG